MAQDQDNVGIIKMNIYDSPETNNFTIDIWSDGSKWIAITPWTLKIIYLHIYNPNKINHIFTNCQLSYRVSHNMFGISKGNWLNLSPFFRDTLHSLCNGFNDYKLAKNEEMFISKTFSHHKRFIVLFTLINWQVIPRWYKIERRPVKRN